MENLKALVYKGDLTPYQRALAQREFEGMIERLEIYEKAVKNNAVLPLVSDTVCEHEWIAVCCRLPLNLPTLKRVINFK